MKPRVNVWRQFAIYCLLRGKWGVWSLGTCRGHTMWDEGHHTCPQVGTPSRGVCTSWLRRCPESRCAKETPYLKNKQALHFWIMTWQLFWCPHVFRSFQRLAWVRFFFSLLALKDFLIVASPWHLLGVILGLLNPSCVHRNNVPPIASLNFSLIKRDRTISLTNGAAFHEKTSWCAWWELSCGMSRSMHVSLVQSKQP